MIYTAETKKAMKLCFEAHKDQKDKSGLPYVFHPFHVAEQMPDEKTTIVALLHDVIEDTSYTLQDLRMMGFDQDVLDALALMTHDKNVPYMDYVAKIRDNEIARTVKLADLRHNSDLTRMDEITETALKRVEKYKAAMQLLLESRSESGVNGDSNGHEFVDLGLSVKWATMNIGAAEISDYGGHFAWGETSCKEDYTWGAYKHGSSADDLTKYSFTDNMLHLEPKDDAAAVNWGGAWRMPTSSEWEELCNKCNSAWEWTCIEDTPGYRITSKKAGYTDKSIFLPAAGYFRGHAVEGAEKSAYYWSSTRNEPFADRALCLYFIPNFIGIGNNGFRNGGFTIRPVIW